MGITNPLFDTNFLEELTSKNEREIYARITALDINELPIEYIEGKITDGTVNVDGKSVVRRTCNLTMVAEDVNINEFYWGLRNKFTLELGLKNLINPKYPDIIWFKLGLFIITQFNTTEATNKWTIKIQGKDKMCLLNGDISGHLPHETDFGKEEYHDLENDTVTYTDIPVKTIIRNIVLEFGRELPLNIIINDIDDAGLELLEYQGDTPAYLYRGKEDNEFKNMTLDGTLSCVYLLKKVLSINEYNLIPEDEYYDILRIYYKINEEDGLYHLDEKLYEDDNYERPFNEELGWFKGLVSDEFNITYDNLLEDVEFDAEPTIIHFPSGGYDENNKPNNYILAKIEYGDMPGYYLTELTYAGDLIGKAGETLTSVLDKIKNMLSNFEYYYDVNGKFVFLKKSEYVISPWNSVDTEDNELYTDATINRLNYMFNFIDSVLISSFLNTPKLTDVKNDYSVWGSYNNSGTEIPIHMRYAIDMKPTEYKPIRPLKEEIITILTDSEGNELNRKITYKYYDAPEIEPYKEDLLEKITDMTVSKNGFSPSKITIKLANGNQLTTITYPYFAINSYKVESEYDIYYKDIAILSLYFPDEYPEPKIKLLENDFKNLKKLEYGLQDLYEYLLLILPAKHYSILEKKVYTKYGVDWRELIYLMALDYRKCHTDDNFLYYIAQANPQYPSGRTGYEQYYIDLEGFWRTLYDPNPTMLYESLTYDKIKNYSILDDSVSNVEDDSIYIEKGYRNITYDEFTSDSLTAGEVYKILTSEDIENGSDFKYTIYPFIGSDECSLSFGFNYYLKNDDNSMTVKIPQDKTDSNYEVLNDNNLNNIYIKNTQTFMTKEKENSENREDFNVLEEENNSLHETRLTEFTEQEIYSNFIDYLKSLLPILLENAEYERFEVPYYPSLGSLDTYKDYANEDYLKFIDVCFDKFKNKDSKEVLENYYLKDPGYVKLSDYYKNEYFWDQLYQSNFITFSNNAKNLIANINSINIDNDDYNTNKFNYLVDYVNFIKDYVIKMNVFTNNEILTSLSTELDKIIEYHSLVIKSKLEIYINSLSESLKKEYSCLPYLFFDGKQGYLYFIELINENNSKSKTDLLTKVQLIQNINEHLNNLFTDVNSNYNDVKFVESLLTDIEKLETTEERKAKIIEYRDSVLTKIKNSNANENMLISKTLFALEDLLFKIESELISSIDGIQENVINYIITPITALKNFYNAADDFIMGIKGTESSAEIKGVINCYIDFLTFLDKVMSIKELLEKKTYDSEIIYSYTVFNRSDLGGYWEVYILPNLYNLVISAQGTIELNERVQKYLKATYDFLEYYLKEDLNNFINEDNDKIRASDKLIYEKINYYRGYYNYSRDYEAGNYWTQDLYLTPLLLIFWFDFLSPSGAELEKISVPTIGTRTKVVNDKNVKAIHYKDIPSIIFKKSTDKDYERKSGFSYIRVNNNTETYFAISSKGKSAKERVDELLYDHAYTPENVSISAIPVYYLEPNHHIFIRDDRSNIHGEYVVNKLTIPLSYKKTMTITASKAVSDII